MLVYRFQNRRQAADAVVPLLGSKHVADVGVVVKQGEVLVGVRTAGKNRALETAWVKGVLGLGQDVSAQFAGFMGWLPEALEVYKTKEGVRRFKGYSYRRRAKNPRQDDEDGKPLAGPEVESSSPSCLL